jgi:hypothetical protein
MRQMANREGSLRRRKRIKKEADTLVHKQKLYKQYLRLGRILNHQILFMCGLLNGRSQWPRINAQEVHEAYDRLGVQLQFQSSYIS